MEFNVRNISLGDRLLDRIDFLEFFKIVSGSFVLAILAQIQIPLGFTPVPVTLQSLGVLLIGQLYGGKSAALTVVLYILEGACGLPVFAGGSYGALKLFGPTGGYLFGFVVAAYVVGFLSQRQWHKQFHSALPQFLLANLVIFVFGVVWLSFFVGVENAFLMGVLPFIPGELVKIFAASAIAPRLGKIIENQ